MSRDIYETIRGHGMCPRTTPVDTLMNAPCPVGLAVADAMLDDGDYEEPLDLDGFHDTDHDIIFLESEDELCGYEATLYDGVTPYA